MFVELLESPGNWTYRSIFLIISVQEFSRYTYFLDVKSLLETLEFDIGRSWNLRCQNMYEPCTVNICIFEAVDSYL